MSAKYKSPSFLLPNEINTNTNPLNTDGNPATGTGINSLYSMNFDSASSDYIDVGTSLGNTLGSSVSDMSVSLWYKHTTGSNQGLLSIISSNSANNSDPFAISYNNNSVYVWFGSSNYNYYAQTNDTDWHHLAIVKNGTSLTTYIDGSSVSPTATVGSIPATINTTNKETFIGLYYNTNFTYNGSIDEVAIFNRALTDGTGNTVNEIAALYDGTGSNIRPSNLMAANLNPIAYYPLGEQAQNTGKLPQATANVWQFPNGVLQDYVMDFDGSDDFVQTSGFTIGNNYSFSCWLKSDTTSPSASVFLSSPNYYSAGYNGNFIIRFSNSTTIQMYSFDGTANSESSAATIPAIDTNWHHFFLTSNGTTTKIYWDGSPLTVTGNQTKSLDNLLQGLIIGYEVNFGNNPFSGEISNVAVWNSDQTANVANIYNNGSPQTTYTVTPQNWWKLNADSVYTPSAPNYTTSLNLPQPLSASNYIDFPAGGSGWSFNDGAGNDTPFTVSAWVYNTSSSSKYRLLSKNNGGNGYEYSISAGGANTLGSIEIYLYDSTGGTYIGSKAALHKPNEWVHVAFTYSANAAATGIKIYANGEQLTDTDVTVGSYTSMGIKTSKPNIGRTVATYGSEGNVSNLTIFNSELTAAQISTLFNFGTPETTPSFSPTLWFKLDNTTTGIQSAGSLTGASYNGTIGGSVTATSPAGVAVIPSWKIPSALPITTTPNYTTALDFNVSRKISLGSSVDLGINSSISLWINMPNTPTIYIPLGEDSYLADYLMYISSTLIYIVIGNVYKTYTHSFNTNEWYNIVIVRQGDSIEVFKNNTSLGTQIGFGTSVTTKIDTIGAKTNGNNPFIGLISNVAVYNSALTNSQVSTLYNNGTPETAVSFSPVSWWKLDTGGSTITDYAGSNNGTNSSPGAAQVTSDVLTLQPVNGVSTTLPSTALQQSDLQFDSPYSNYSLSFDGNSYIDTNFTLPASYTSFSYSFWFKRTTSANPGTEYIISNLVAPGNNTQARGLIRFGVTNLRIQGGDGTSPDYDTGNISATAILDQNWHHISVTFVSGEIKTYFDGSLVNTYTNSLVVTGYAADRTYVIGQNGIGTGYLVNSRLDEFAIFDKKLTEAEILSIYNSGRPGDISPIAPTNWWRLGENAYFVNNDITLPNSVSGAPNGVSSGTATSMLTADAPGTYANGIGTNLDIVDRVGDAPLSTANSQSYNMIPDNKVPYVPGYVGDQISNTYSMAFDASSSDYMVLSNFTSGFTSGANANNGFTVSVWVNIDNVIQVNWRLLGSGDTADGPFTIHGSGPQVRFSMRDSATTLNTLTTSDAPLTGRANEWIHLAYVWDGTAAAGGRMKIYIDGVQNTSATINGPTSLMTSGISAIFSSDTYIGAYRLLTPGTGSDMMMDEMAIFDKTLTADQIKFDLYNATTAGKTADIANNPNLPTPAAWYRMGD